MPFDSITIIRLCGIAGILGALVTGLGDLLYNHIPGSTQSLYEKMSTFPRGRLISAGALGLIGSWLYSVSTFHVYFAFRSAGDDIALTIAIAFAWVAIAYGVGHASYYAIGSNARLARENGLDVEAAGKSGEALFTKVAMITYIPAAIMTLLMTYAVFTGRSFYPIWMIFFLPVVSYLLRPVVLKVLPGRLREIVRDWYDNFVMFLYFLVSTVLLWSV